MYMKVFGYMENYEDLWRFMGIYGIKLWELFEAPI